MRNYPAVDLKSITLQRVQELALLVSVAAEGEVVDSGIRQDDKACSTTLPMRTSGDVVRDLMCSKICSSRVCTSLATSATSLRSPAYRLSLESTTGDWERLTGACQVPAKFQ